MTTKTPKLKTIHIIEHGEYSDYSVDAAFEDEATANAWAKAMNAAKGENGSCYDYEVRAFPLVPAGTKPFQVTTYQQTVELWDDGRINDRGILSTTDWAIGAYRGIPPRRPYVRYVRAPYQESAGGGGILQVIGDNEKAVAKVTGEKIAMWKAGAWGGPGYPEIIEGGKFA